MEFNIYFFAVLATLMGFYLLDLISNLLNLSALEDDLPGEFVDTFDVEKYAKSQMYARAGTRFEIVQTTFMLAVFLCFWFAGGFAWLDQWVRGFGQGPVVSGLICLSALYLASEILSLPFTLYDTFVLETKFGFNKTTPGTFAGDLFKGLALGAIIGLPITALVLWFFEYAGSSAWFLGWIAVGAFSLILSYVAPRVIMPLFHKFTPLERGDLKSSIEKMAAQCRFPLKDVFVVDGSRRSTKGNAFFVGFGRNKKIALYDTLVEEQEVDELVGVLAHEIGHFKKKHILQHMIFALVQLGIVFFLLGVFMKNDALFAAFGVPQTSVYLSLVFFTLLYKPLSRVLSIAGSILSRKNEFEADAYAARVTRNPDCLIRALKKLGRNNLSNLTPHPFHVFMFYSHPPLLERINALRTVAD